MPAANEKTVREIAVENPASVKVFESIGIDYCCGGKRTLSDACARAGIPVDRVLAMIAEAESGAQPGAGVNWAEAPLRALAAHIVETHHGFVRREIPRIQSLMMKVVGRHGGAHPELREIESIFDALAQELSPHMMKEERVLFPYIGEMEAAIERGDPAPPAFFGSVARPIAAMMAEHDDAGALLERLRELSGEYEAPDDACPTYRALYHGLEAFEQDLHQHVHLENNILFPRAAAMEAASLPVS
jgi:regulator of cell morphogenesis and NO signaling